MRLDVLITRAALRTEFSAELSTSCFLLYQAIQALTDMISRYTMCTAHYETRLRLVIFVEDMCPVLRTHAHKINGAESHLIACVGLRLVCDGILAALRSAAALHCLRIRPVILSKIFLRTLSIHGPAHEDQCAARRICSSSRCKR